MADRTEAPRLWRYCHAAGRTPPDGFIVGGLGLLHEGLLLISNDAEVARLLSLAAAGWVSHFAAGFRGSVQPGQMKLLSGAPVVDGLQFGPVTARPLPPQGKTAWLDIALREGRGRDVARLLAAAGLTPTHLARTSFGPFRLGGLLAGALEDVPDQDWQLQLGGKFISSHADRRRKIQRPASRNTRR
jgi:23S rRNA pseudouridine2605 synthase